MNVNIALILNVIISVRKIINKIIMENGITNDEFEASYKFVKELDKLNINMRTQSEIEKQPTYKDFETCLDEYKHKNILNKDTLSYTLIINSINS